LAPALNILAGLILPPDGASPNADDIAELYLLILIMAAVVFVGVEGLLIWFMLKFKARRGRVAAQIHGNTRLEVGWTIGAAVILVFITVFTFIKLPAIKDPAASDIDANGNPVAGATLVASTDQPPPPGNGPHLNIRVNGQQYVWRYRYPKQGETAPILIYSDMIVPVGMTVTLEITADDVAHSWWIPKLGGKMDAIPGYTNHTWFRADKPGTYRGQCAELCGRNHANMLAAVHVVPPAQYQEWYRRQAAAITAAKKAQQQGAQRLQQEQQQGGTP
jgi:cytochrome c oxidase subunit II